MSGLFQGSLSIKELLEKGDMGIGTVHALDGELVVLDGVPYVVKVDGSVAIAEDENLTPYAAVTNFSPETAKEFTEAYTKQQLHEKLQTEFASLNTFQAIQITGTFENILCRSVAKQTEPYPRLATVAESQAEFARESIQGTMLGFFTPEAYGTIAVPGFHLHFISDTKDYGGHVLEYSLKEGTAKWQTIETLEQHFPINNTTFMEDEIDYDTLEEDIEAAE
jgi:acetolactate decarboxylase